MDLKTAKQRAIDAINAIEEDGDIFVATSVTGEENTTMAFVSRVSTNFLANVIATIEEHHRETFRQTLQHIVMKQLADDLKEGNPTSGVALN